MSDVSVMRSLAMLVADFWSRHIRPVAFDGVFYINGARVRLSVSDYVTEDDTLPMRRIQDEDDKISD